MSAADARKTGGERLVVMLFVVTLVTLLAVLGAQSTLTLGVFEREAEPVINQKSAVLARSLERKLARAVELGVPLDRLRGMDELLGGLKAGNPEVAYLTVTDPAGRLLHGNGEGGVEPAAFAAAAQAARMSEGGEASLAVGGFRHTAVTLSAAGRLVAVAHVGVRGDYVSGRMREIAYDIATVLVVSLLATLEVLVIVVATRIAVPMRLLKRIAAAGEAGDFRLRNGFRGGDEIGRLGQLLNSSLDQVNYRFGRLVDDFAELRGRVGGNVEASVAATIEQLKQAYRFCRPDERVVEREPDFAHARLVLFLFIMSEELTRSFLPRFVAGLHNPFSWLTPELAVSLPMALYMLILAGATPWAGGLVEKHGPRRIFFVALVPTILGLCGSALAVGLADFLVWRGLTALGYAMATIAGQGYISRIATPEDRVKGMAVFLGAVTVAAICGTAFGGVLAERIGHRGTLAVAASVAAVSGISAFHLLYHQESRGALLKPFRWSSLGAMMGNRRFAVLVLGVAIPAKVLLTGILFYVTPLYLSSLGVSQPDIGRVMMAYYVVNVLVTKGASLLADRLGGLDRFVAVGGLVAGVAPLAVLLLPGAWAVAAVVLTMSIGHALAVSPTMALAIKATARESEALGQTTVLGAFRSLERAGSIAGPFLAGGLAAVAGYEGAMLGLAAVGIIGAAGFYMAFDLKEE